MNFDEVKKSVVLIVVEGPDPKDKIIKENPFFVSTSSTKKISASGIVIDKKKNLILTNGTLFSHFLNEKSNDISPECNITILIDSKTKFNAKFIKILKSTSANKCKKVYLSIGISQMTLGSCDWFWGWNSDFEKKVSTTPSCMALLETERDISSFDEHGEEIFVISSPFGILSPTTFQNSISKGIVSNVLGISKNHVLMTDARMLPGSEGGGIFNQKGELIGICTIPLKRSDTTVEINFGICSDIILDELKDVLHKSKSIQIATNGIDEILNFSKKSLVQVHVSYSWASGIIISSDGYILTNAHLFEPHLVDGNLEKGTYITIQLDSDLTKSYEASLVYCSKGPLDISIIKVDLKNLFPVNLSNPPRYEEGQKIFVIGYPLFTPESKLSSTITTGIISKICRIGGIPTMIQTSAQVHKGNSGGLLVNAKGEFLGLITSNLKHNLNNGSENESSVLIPSLNFVIPVERLAKIDEYLKKDLKLLLEYDRYNKQIKDLWEFREPSEKPSKFMEFMDKIQKGGKISKL